ncbi:MAG TPA: immunoglobulin-like domain-containing protein [Mobilitalea sp.]|nr:immunoglobulin-like domain-containing protein [Mobilitalea sp.]
MRKKNVLKLLVIGILVFTAVLLQRTSTEAESIPDSNIFDISEGNITVAATGSAIQVTYGASQSKVIAANEEITITGATTSNCITVNGVAANITLNTVDIQLSTADICAFALTGGANVTLTLKDGTTNILTSGANKAGLQVNLGQTLTILGLGKLTVTGGNSGAGIGGSYSSNNSSVFTGGTINIQNGEIIAHSSDYGAGIGGALYGNGGSITISGGNVTAIGGSEAAGIGGGGQSSGGNISITGGIIRAVGGRLGAGIGDGNGCNGTNNIRIENSTVIALGGSKGAGIGGSYGGGGATGDTITISDTAIIKAASDGTNPAIYAASDTLASGSTASILLITPTSALPANTNVSVYYKSPYSLYTSFNPTIEFKSIAISIPTISTYELTIGGNQQKNATGTDYVVSTAGITLFSSEYSEVAADKAALTDSLIKGSNTDLSHITGALAALPTAGSVNASAVTWSSSKSSILSNDGQTVVRPAYGTGDATVTLTATITKGIVTDTKVFNITVLAETVNPDIAKVAADKAALTDSLIKGSNTDLSHITGALAGLPTAGLVNASTITWSSSNPSILSNDGQTVVRPAYSTGDATVTLTATITKGIVTDTKVFNITVLAETINPEEGLLQIGTTTYESWAAAVSAVQAGQTITLLNNVTLTESDTMPAVACTIDGGSSLNTLTLSSDQSLQADTTLKNLKLYYSEDGYNKYVYCSYLGNKHKLNIIGTVSATNICIEDGSELNIDGTLEVGDQINEFEKLTVASGSSLITFTLYNIENAEINGTVTCKYFDLIKGGDESTPLPESGVLSGNGSIIFTDRGGEGSSLVFYNVKIDSNALIKLDAQGYTPIAGDYLVTNLKIEGSDTVIALDNISRLTLGSGYSGFKLTGENQNYGYNYVLEASSTIPNRKPVVTATASAIVMSNSAYTLNLLDIFEDAENNALTFKVSINGASAVAANANYSYTPTAAGTIILEFTANDGTADSTDTYTVTLNVTAPAPVNTIPNRKSGTSATATASVTVNSAYALNLENIFEDADNNTLTYQVSVNGGGV